VVGGKYVGKTSLLSHIVNGEFGEAYHSTRHAQSFFDCFRGIEFIDVPGLSDVFGEEDVKTGSLSRERLEHLWDQFFRDTEVQTLLPIASEPQLASFQMMLSQRSLYSTSSYTGGESGTGGRRIKRNKKKFSHDLNLSLIDTYLIVFNDDYSEQIAKALWYALKVLKNKEKQVFVVRNVHMEFPDVSLPQSTSSLSKIYHRQAGFSGPNWKELKTIFDVNAHFPVDEEGQEGVVIDEKKKEEEAKEAKEAKIIPGIGLKRKGCRGIYLGEICVKTGEGIAEMLDILSLHLHASQEMNEQSNSKASLRQCSLGDCIIM